MRTRESEEERQGGAWRLRASRRKQEVARGKQEVAEASRACAMPLFVLLAEEEEDKGEEVGWASQMGWPAGPVLVDCTGEAR